jgi:hypothetical protein
VSACTQGQEVLFAGGCTVGGNIDTTIAVKEIAASKK